MQKVCSASDIAAFDANFKGASNYSDLIKGLSPVCGSCILGREADATWTFVVTDDKGELGFFNYGACYARAAGGSDACGKAVQYSKFCINASCADCAFGPESSACEADTATQTACSALFAGDIQTGCGTDSGKLKALDDACGTPSHAVGVLCGDSDAGDAGDGG
ncbi:MAG: hypothetical protein JWM74_2983 [Myxococcaceae bacterium]|nr:hypothetical protein [Myxococcaceae bacterium]